jgi:hypothetical protein
MGVSALLFCLFHSAEGFASGIADLFRIHSQPYVLLGLLFDVVAQLLI